MTPGEHSHVKSGSTSASHLSTGLLFTDHQFCNSRPRQSLGGLVLFQETVKHTSQHTNMLTMCVFILFSDHKGLWGIYTRLGTGR